MEKQNNSDLALGIQSLLLPENVHTMEDLVVLAKDIGLDYVVIALLSAQFSNTEIYKDIDYKPYLDLGDKLSIHNTSDFNVVFRINTINNWLSQQDQRY